MRRGFVLGGGGGGGEPERYFLCRNVPFLWSQLLKTNFADCKSGVVREAHCTSGKLEIKILLPQRFFVKWTWISTSSFITSKLLHIWQKYTKQAPHTMKPLWGAQKLQQICLFSCQQWGGHNPSQHFIQSCVCLQSSWPGSAMQYKCCTNLWLVFWQAHHCKLLEPLNRCGVQPLNGRIWSGAVTWGLSWTNCMR